MLDGNIRIDTQLVSVLDMVALGWFLLVWFGYGYLADKRYHTRRNLMQTMDSMRMRWMQNMVRRDNRITDATIIGNLLRAIAFFASTAILILVGLANLFDRGNDGAALINHIPFAEPTSPFMWETKLILLCLIFIYAFFKLTWSLRQYNYASILVGAAPDPQEEDSVLSDYSYRVGKLISNAGKHFNLGLRGFYFGMAAASWFVHGGLFILMSTLTVAVVYRREFLSHTVNNLRGMDEF